MRIVAAILALAPALSGGTAWAKDSAALKAWKKREAQIQAIAKQAMPAVVAVEGIAIPAMGSGVVIDEHGHILTAAHVILSAGDEVRIRFSDGRTAMAQALGANLSSDTGLLQLKGKGEWPYVKTGDASKLKDGDWVVAAGHPGGFDIDRAPPLRMGRVWNKPKGMLATDCSLASGDSGGPLFDIDGKVVGIHSSIGEELSQNRHIAVNVFANQWKRLKAGERWGSLSLLTSAIDDPTRPMLGVILVRDRGKENGATVREVVDDSPADRAGLEAGDRIVRIGKKGIVRNRDLISHISGQAPGTTVTVEFFRKGTAQKSRIRLEAAAEITFPGAGEVIGKEASP